MEEVLGAGYTIGWLVLFVGFVIAFGGVVFSFHKKHQMIEVLL